VTLIIGTSKAQQWAILKRRESGQVEVESVVHEAIRIQGRVE